MCLHLQLGTVRKILPILKARCSFEYHKSQGHPFPLTLPICLPWTLPTLLLHSPLPPSRKSYSVKLLK